MEAINFKVASDEYQLLPHTGFDAIDLDRKVLGLIGKMARQGLDINDDVEAFALLANTLSELSTPDFKWLLETTLSAVTVVTKAITGYKSGITLAKDSSTLAKTLCPKAQTTNRTATVTPMSKG